MQQFVIPVLVLMTAIGLGLRPIGQADDLPHLLYYQPEVGLVMERVGGADRRVVTSAVENPAQTWFSSSGEWLAWRASRDDTQYDGLTHIPDGQTILLPDGHRLVSRPWSPSADLVLVQDEAGRPYVFDPAAETTRFTYSDSADLPRWTADGDFITFWRGRALVAVDGRGTAYERMSDNGVIGWQLPGTLAYWQGAELVLEDLASGTMQRYAIPFPVSDGWMFWSGDGRHAIIQSGHAYLLSLDDATLTDLGDIHAGVPQPIWFAPDDSRALIAVQCWAVLDVDVTTGSAQHLSLPRRERLSDHCWVAPHLIWHDDGAYLQWANVRWRYADGVFSQLSNAEGFMIYQDYFVYRDRDFNYRFTDGEGGAVLQRLDAHAGLYGRTIQWHPTEPWLLVTDEGPFDWITRYAFDLRTGSRLAYGDDIQFIGWLL